MTTPFPIPHRKVTIDEIAAVASGEGGPALEARVQEAAAREPQVGATLASFLAIVAAMENDHLLEPPAEAVQRAKALGSRLSARRAATRSPLATLGEVFDRAGAVVLGWLDPNSGLALAGVRDDRGADLLEATIDATAGVPQLMIRAERTPAQDGVVRLVGEVTRGDDMPVKAMVAVLDAHGVVLSTDETDALGMFALPLPRESHEVVVSAHASDGTDHPTIVLPLGPDGLATVGREPRG